MKEQTNPNTQDPKNKNVPYEFKRDKDKPKEVPYQYKKDKDEKEWKKEDGSRSGQEVERTNKEL